MGGFNEIVHIKRLTQHWGFRKYSVKVSCYLLLFFIKITFICHHYLNEQKKSKVGVWDDNQYLISSLTTDHFVLCFDRRGLRKFCFTDMSICNGFYCLKLQVLNCLPSLLLPLLLNCETNTKWFIMAGECSGGLYIVYDNTYECACCFLKTNSLCWHVSSIKIIQKIYTTIFIINPYSNCTDVQCSVEFSLRKLLAKPIIYFQLVDECVIQHKMKRTP